MAAFWPAKTRERDEALGFLRGAEAVDPLALFPERPVGGGLRLQPRRIGDSADRP